MLGKNQLEKIEGLETLTRLDVLDLHSNQITTVEHLNHMPELRVLNLAGNQIVNVDNLEGLVSLTELNLRRNQIQNVRSLDTLPNLQRVFVSNNLLSSFESLQCIFLTKHLLELALDGNPVAQEAGYRQVVLDNLKGLRHLDLKRVTEEERRLASLQVCVCVCVIDRQSQGHQVREHINKRRRSRMSVSMR
jgi:leucine-rich repeat-containing protein 49